MRLESESFGYVWINFVSKMKRNEAPELWLHVSDDVSSEFRHIPTRQHSEAFDCGSSRQQPRFGRRRGTWQLCQDMTRRSYWNPIGILLERKQLFKQF